MRSASRSPLLLLLAAVLAATSACSLLKVPDKKISDDAAASWTYHDARYHRLCPAKDDPRPAGPPGCRAYKTAIDELGWQAQTSRTVYVVGALPPEQKKAIKAAEKAVGRLP